MSTGELAVVLRPHLHAQAEAFTAAVALVRADEGYPVHDAVHKLRVAARRYRSIVQAFDDEFADTDATALVERLRRLGRECSRARDAQVQRARMIDALGAVPIRGPVRERIGAAFDAEMRSAREAALAAVDAERSLPAELYRLAGDAGRSHAETPASVATVRVLGRQEARIDRRVAAACSATTDASERDAALHLVRKAVKRLRYVLEAVTPLCPGRARPLVAALSELQDDLGERQDSVLARRWLLTLAEEAERAGESAFTYGALHQREVTSSAFDVDDLTGNWRRIRDDLRGMRRDLAGGYR